LRRATRGRGRVADDMQARSLSFDGALAIWPRCCCAVALAKSRPKLLTTPRSARGSRRWPRARSGVGAALLPDRAAGQGRSAARARRARGFLMTVLRMLAFRPEGRTEKLPAPRRPSLRRTAAAAEGQRRGRTRAGAWRERAGPPALSAAGSGGAARELARNAELRGREQKSSTSWCRRRRRSRRPRASGQAQGGARAASGRRGDREGSVGEVSGRSAAAIEAGSATRAAPRPRRPCSPTASCRISSTCSTARSSTQPSGRRKNEREMSQP
jgi:hypothetical protein